MCSQVLTPSPFYMYMCIFKNTALKKIKRGRPGNEATVCVRIHAYIVCLCVCKRVHVRTCP